jgi:hypothetical protein
MCKSSVKDQITKITEAVERMVNTATAVISGRIFRKFRRVPPSPLQYVRKASASLSEVLHRIGWQGAGILSHSDVQIPNILSLVSGNVASCSGVPVSNLSPETGYSAQNLPVFLQCLP